MIKLLARLFISNRNDYDNPAVRRAYGVLCSGVGIGLNLCLFALKYLAGVLTGSIAITADAFNNLSDVGSSVITLIGFKISGKRNDTEHPFGHGRYEYIAGLIVSLIIMMMGFDLVRTSIGKIISPEPVAFQLVSILILVAAILVKLYMAAYNFAVSKKINSVAMRATALDSLSDVAATTAVLISMLVLRFAQVNIDPYAGILVSALILRAGYMAAKETISPLLGKAPDPELVHRIVEIVRSYDMVRGIHDLVVHDYGASRLMITLHVEVPADGDIVEMHDMIDTIERRLSEELRCQAVIHMDPISTDDALVTQTGARVLETLHERLHKDITIHDFRMVAGPTHTNVIFDAVVPLDMPESDAELRTRICRLVNAMDSQYYAVVTVDRPCTQYL